MELTILILKMFTFSVGIVIVTTALYLLKLCFNGDMKTIRDKDMTLGQIYNFIKNR